MAETLNGSQAVLDTAMEFLRGRVAPLASEMDHDPEVMRTGLQGLCERGLMALRRPVEFGGPAVNESVFRAFQEEVARASGALAFLQTQHQSAVSLLAKGDNNGLKAEWLPKMHNGQALVGIGFSQLRRPGPPLTRAMHVEGGFQIDGHVPWVTGFGFFDHFMIGAQLEDGRAVFALVPFREAPGLRFSEPMILSAMQGAQTVTADLDQVFVSDAMVVDIKPAGWIFRNDQINITLQGFFAIGCARAAVDVMRATGEKRERAALLTSADALDREIVECRSRLQQAQAESEDTTEEKLALRAWAITLMGRCAHAAVAAVGGAANSPDHPANRILRESIVFTVSAQTEAIQEATLKSLVFEGESSKPRADHFA